MSYKLVSTIILLLILLPVTFIDLKKKKIPDLFTYPGIILFLILRIVYDTSGFYSYMIMALMGFLPFFLIWYFTKGKMGLGDAKLSALLAVALGIRGWFYMVFFSSFIAVSFSVIMLILKKVNRTSRIPYAPFMSLGALVSLSII